MRKFYIIGVTYKVEGVFALVNSVIDHSIFARKNGYIPIVDLKHYDNQYFKDGRVYKDNSWEYFFEQPNGYGLNDIEDSSEVIISPNRFFADFDSAIYNEDVPVENTLCIDENLQNKKELFKNALKFNCEIQKYFDEKTTEIRGENTLGILCRGTDYTKKRPRGEQIQPPVKTIISKAKELMQKYPEITKIYVATEDDEIYQKFKKEFGDILIENKQYKYFYDANEKRYLSQIKPERKNHNYILAKEYLLSIYILSKCKYFIGGRTTGSKWAWILADNWEYHYIWDLGRYGMTFKQRLFSVTTEQDEFKIIKIIRFLGLKFKFRIG